MDRIEFERRLADCGWTFHAGLCQFRDGSRVIDFDDALHLLPGVTEDELTAWADDRMAEAEAENRGDSAG